MLRLWCAGKLGTCPQVNRFRFTCLYCRSRRRFYGKFTDPPYWIDYTYISKIVTEQVDELVQDGVVYRALDGGKLIVEYFTTVKIDPRGKWTMFRCAAIIVFDKIMSKIGFHKPLEEVCELLANFPT